MPPSNNLIVADTGPLIALARLEQLELLPALFSQVLLTPMILAECEARPDRGEGLAIRAAVDAGRFDLAAPSVDLPVWGLDPGETSAIALALAKDAGVLIDDKAGRRVAHHLGVAVIGTAGLLVLAKRKGHLSSVRPHLEALTASGYFLGAGVLADALHLAGESAGRIP